MIVIEEFYIEKDDIEEADSKEGYEESASASVPVASVPVCALVSVSGPGPGPASASIATPVGAYAGEISANVTASDAVALWRSSQFPIPVCDLLLPRSCSSLARMLV
jgi:hypothetical protein